MKGPTSGRRARARRPQKMRRGWASASCAACRRRTRTWMKESWNRCRQFGLSCDQRLGRERDRRRRLGDDDVGAVLLQLGARREVGHLADRGAGAELGDLLAVAEDLDLALRDDVEAAALLALAIQRVAEVRSAATWRGARPPRDRRRRSAPKNSSERSRLKRSESSTPCRLAARHLLVRDQARQRLRELVPVGVALGRGCLASARWITASSPALTPLRTPISDAGLTW